MSTVNRGELADFLGISGPTLDSRVRQGMPGSKVGKSWEFDTVKVIEWMVKQATKDKGPNKKADAELRILVSDAELKEYKVAEQRRTMIHVDDITPIFEEQAAIIKSKVGALPARLAQRLAVEMDPAVVLRILKDEVSECLEEIAKTEGPDPDRAKHGFGGKVHEDEGAGVDDDDATPPEEPRLTEDGY